MTMLKDPSKKYRPFTQIQIPDRGRRSGQDFRRDLVGLSEAARARPTKHAVKSGPQRKQHQRESTVPGAVIGLGALDQIAEEQVLLIGRAIAAMQVVQQCRWIGKTGQSAVAVAHRGETALEVQGGG